jgi:hypothetical protein
MAFGNAVHWHKAAIGRRGRGAIVHVFDHQRGNLMRYRQSEIGRGRAADIAARAFPIIGLLLAAGSPASAQAQRDTLPARGDACAGDNGGITLPPGFCATVFADKIGHARHLVVAPNGVVYVNT